MGALPPPRLLKPTPLLRASGGPLRGPVALAIAIAVALLAGAIVIHGATLRAARLAVRGQGSAIVESIRRESRVLGAPPTQADLQNIVNRHDRDGLKYLATLDARGSIAFSAGSAVGSGVPARDPERFGKRLRATLPPFPGDMPPPDMRLESAPPTMIFEFEVAAADDIATAAYVTLGVVVLLDVVMIVMAVVFARSLRQREALAFQLEADNRLAALGEMSAVLAHEIKNPLTSLKGHAQLLVEVLPPEGPQKAKAERVVADAVRLERLTNDLLEFVRTGALRKTNANVADVVKAAVGASGVTHVNVEVASTIRPRELDVERLALALQNLIRNARDAARDEPIDVVVREPERDALEIAVRDRGPGIPAGQEAEIFRPFRTDKLRGVGLGLAIARRIVELHGGDIVASNHPEGGAVFTIRIPARLSSKAAT